MSELRAAAGFMAGLRPFLRRRITPADAHRRLERSLDARAQAFGRIVQRAVFEHDPSPYRRLFASAHITLGDVQKLLATVGLEGTLERLYDAGIHLTLEEFKGLHPVTRAGLTLDVRADDFDNPLAARHYETHTGGSGGHARRILVGLDLLEHETAYHAGFYAVHQGSARAIALWLPAPPGAVGIKNALITAKLGHPAARWFSQTRPHEAPVRHRAFARTTAFVAGGGRIPTPEYTPASDAARIVDWLAASRTAEHPPILLTTPSAAVRTCAEAMAGGKDIRGTLFVLVGEPYTRAKADVLRAAGCTAASHYAMVEAGMIGLACHAPSAPDDVHLVGDKIATIERERSVDGNGTRVRALVHTTLLPASPKIMINVESGDYGVREERDCGCGVLPPTFRAHLHSIRSYEKLTSEGMHFLGNDLLSLIEQVLPNRFGGNPTDYQLVEAEERGVSRVSLVVSPSVGELDSEEVVRIALDFLRGRGPGQHLMAEVWANSRTLHVVRGTPHVTSAGKIQPLRKIGA